MARPANELGAMTVDDDGLEIEVTDRGYRWTYQSSGGAFFQGPRVYKSKAPARKAGRAWLAEQRRI